VEHRQLSPFDAGEGGAAMSAIKNLANAPPPTPEEAYARKVEFHYEQSKAKRDASKRLRDEECPPKPIPQPRSLRDRLANKTQPIPYRIAELLLYGQRVMLVAQFKAGKTTMVVNLIRSLVDNRPFLNRFPVRAVVDVTLIDAEMASEDTNQLDEWYERAGIKNQDHVKVVALRGAASSFNIIDPIVRRQWADNLRGTKFLILDCLRPILDALGLDENKDAGKFYVAFDALLAEAGIREAMIVTHMGHANERARGDSRNLDWPDVTWNLVRLDEDPSSARFFKAFGRGVDHRETALDFDPKSVELTLGQGSRKDEKGFRAIPAIVAFVQAEANPPTNARIRKGVHDAEGISDAILRRAIVLAVKGGELVETVGPKNAKLYTVGVAPNAARPSPF
jgi:hypothetical protein